MPKFLKVPSELGDGQHSEIVDASTPTLDFSHRIEEWFEDSTVGEKIEFEVVEMTQDEFDNLPEI